MMDFNVAGTGFKSDGVKKALEVFKANTRGLAVKLVPEPTNPYDKYAVGVYLDAGEDYEFVHVGYVPKDFSEEFTEYFNNIENVKLKFIGKLEGIRGTTITIEFGLNFE